MDSDDNAVSRRRQLRNPSTLEHSQWSNVNDTTINTSPSTHSDTDTSTSDDQADHEVVELVATAPDPEKRDPTFVDQNNTDDSSGSTSVLELLHLTCYLENKGSVARDHLANERTFLAWVRTAMTFITFAIGVVQFYRLEFKAIQSQLEIDGSDINQISQGERHRLFHALSKPIALMFIILGALSLLFGTFRYYQVQLHMLNNTFPAARFSLVLLVVLLFAILVILTVLDVRLTLT